MKTRLLALSLTLFIQLAATAQETPKSSSVHIYDPSANAQQDIKNAVDKAAKEGRHVLLQIGG